MLREEEPIFELKIQIGICLKHVDGGDEYCLADSRGVTRASTAIVTITLLEDVELAVSLAVRLHPLIR